MNRSDYFNFKTVPLIALFFSSIMVAQTFTGQELLARPTDTSVTLNVVSSSALDAYVEYGTATGTYPNTTSTVSAAANVPIVILINGLTANTKYFYRLRYRVTGGGAFSARTEHSFRTQRPTGSTFTFDITSDSHVNIQLGNATTWQNTLTNVAADNPDFLLDLGDTFAMDNVTTAATADANYLFQRTATKLGLVSHSVPIFLAVGNHEQEEAWHLDDNGNPVNSQPVWATNAQKRYFPNPVSDAFYTGNSDTYYALNGDQLREDYYAWTWGDALFVVIDPFWYTYTKPFLTNLGGGESSDVGSGDRWDWTLGQTQYNWLKQTLENSNAKFKFLFMHHMTGGVTVGSNDGDYIRGGAYAATYCEWGGYNENGTTYAFGTRRPGWYAPIHQVLVENNVSAVFHGHDHQYAYEKRDGIVYQSLPAAGFSSGFGVYSDGGYTIKALASAAGHLRVIVSPSQATVDYINTASKTVSYTYNIQPPGIIVNTKIFLQGPYTSNAMTTNLNSALLPTSHPYNTSPWNYSGTESVAGGFFTSHTNIVDWVLVELRTGIGSGTIVGTRAAFLKSDGTIVDLDGTSAVSFTSISAGNYYIVIRHRNHLAVMSANTVALSGSSSLYDFTTGTSKYYGSDAASLAGGKYGMYAGDANSDGGVYAEDYTAYKLNQGLEAYSLIDFNMDGGVYAEDYTIYKINQGKETNVPL